MHPKHEHDGEVRLHGLKSMDPSLAGTSVVISCLLYAFSLSLFLMHIYL